MSNEIPFESEYVLHKLTQKNLEELFGLEFVASEIQLNDLRLDNLAFDPETNSFVIIEYKNELNLNVINQAQEYYELLNDNKDDFKERLDDNVDVDFESTRVMIIGPEFIDSQLEGDFDIWKITLFDDCRVTYENLKTEEVKTLEITEDDLKLTRANLLDDKSDEIIGLYDKFENSLLNEFDDINIKYLVDAVSVKSHGKFLCNVNVKNSIKIYYYTDKLDDFENRTRDISQITTGGPKVNYELELDEDNIDYAIDLIRQVYEQKVLT
jgi:predicted transport protein